MLSNKIYLDEKIIISKYLKKLNFNKEGTYKFQNDASFLKTFKNKIIVTTDSISEKIDFFKNDNPRSIANKITTCNLSDLSAMGAYPYCYTLSLSIPKNLNEIWFKKFSKKLFSLQKKYNFFLLGGDLSHSKKIIISSNFFGYSPKGKIIKRKGAKINHDIWVTGNLGESTIGLKILQKKIQSKKSYLKKSSKNTFKNFQKVPQNCIKN